MDLDSWCFLNSHSHSADLYGNEQFFSGKLKIYEKKIADWCTFDLGDLYLNLISIILIVKHSDVMIHPVTVEKDL